MMNLEEIKNFECTGGVSEEEILSAEEKLGLKFSDEYRKYLSKYGTGFFDTMEPTGLNVSKRINVVDVTLFEKGCRELPEDVYVVENLGIDGIIIVQNTKGEIFEANMSGNLKKIYNNFLEYILSNNA